VPLKLSEVFVVFVIGDCASEHQDKVNFAIDACAMPNILFKELTGLI
jgi:hypothetical protein